MILLTVLGAALVAGLLAGALAWHFPALDPAAPRVSSGAIVDVATRPPVAGFLRSRLNPEELTGLLLTAALSIALGGAIAIGALFVMVDHNAALARWDLSAARWGASDATPASTRVLRDIALLGGTAVSSLIAVAVAILEYHRTRVRAVFWFLLVVVGGQVVLVNITKWVVDRPRPHIAQLTGFSGSSFPSGHAATAAATFAAVAFLIGRGRPRAVKAMLTALAAAIAVAVATTRVFLGVHWFTDVLAGLAFGWGWFALCSIAFGGRVLRFGQPVAVAEEVAELSKT